LLVWLVSLIESPRAPRRVPTWLYRGSSLALYVALTCWLYGLAILDNTRIIGAAGSDMVQEVWFLAWPAYALTHGHSVFFTTWMNYPHGVNMMANTSMPLLGLVGAPITWLFGPVVTYTLFMRLGFILSAASAQFVARRVGLSRAGSLAAGLLYGFSTLQIVQGNGHMFLVFAPLPPLILYCVYCLVIERWRPYAAGALAGLLTAIDFLISAERALMTLMVLGVVLVVAAAVLWRRVTRQLVVNFLVAGACAALVAGVALAVPVHEMLGRGHVSGVAHPWIQSYATDLAAFVFPGPFTWLDPFHMKASILAATSQWENGSYVGIPLLVALVVAAVRGRRHRLVLVGAIATVIVAGMSMGEILKIDGVHHTSFHSPYVLLTHLKYVQNIEPIRLMYLAWLGVALLGGYALDRLIAWAREREPRVVSRPLRAGLAALAVLAVLASLLPDHPYKMPSTQVSAWLQGAEARREIPADSVVLFYPYPTLLDNHALLDQAVTGFHYKVIGGEGLAGNAQGVNVGIQPLKPYALPSVFIRTEMGLPTGPVTPLPITLPDQPPLDAATTAAFRRFVVRNHVETIVVENATGSIARAAMAYLLAAFGAPATHDDGTLAVWTHRALEARVADLTR
jgi:hypothetical protein